MSAIPTVSPHPLKSRVRAAGISLWQIRLALGGRPSDATISRMLNGIIPMSSKVEKGIKRLLSEVEVYNEQ